MSDDMYDICMHYFMCVEHPEVQWYMNEITIKDAENDVLAEEAATSVMWGNVDYYFKKLGWIDYSEVGHD